MTYFINGWKVGRSYFMSLGRFTTYELKDILNGEIVKKGDNEFWIVIDE